MIKNLSPMDDVYEERLFEVFRELANNMVVVNCDGLRPGGDRPGSGTASPASIG